MNVRQLFSNSFKTTDGKYNNVFTEKELNLIHENKLFKCFLPEHLGGLGMGLNDTLSVILDCAYMNGSLGWMIQIGNGGNYFITNLSSAVAEELFSPKEAVLTGSGTPTGVAKPTEGGYIFSGISRCASGSNYATLFTLTAYIEGTKDIISAIIPREKVRVINDWDTIGMRLTSTNTVAFEPVFVPQERVFKTSHRVSYFDLPILDLPFVIYAQAFFMYVVFGLVERFLDEAGTILESKKNFWQIEKPERYQKAMISIQKGRTLLSKSKALCRDLFDQIEHDKLHDTEFHEHTQIQIVREAIELKQYAHDSFPIYGMEVLDRKHVMNVVYSDLITICQHALLN